LNVPILFLIFNRPQTTAIVFDKIKQQQPAKLYIAADGFRKNKEGEKALCEETKRIVLDGIDWDCEIKTLFRNENLGCGRAVSQAITWFFEHEEEGIILEDDCLPNESFFLYCADLLGQYRDNPTIMHISATNLNDSQKFGDATYYFSNYPHIWGWATWRRAWASYNFELNDTKFYNNLIDRLFTDPFEHRFWKTVLNTVDKIDTWDYQWMFSVFKSNGICANTNYNFILNIGFGEDATHTAYASPYTNLKQRHVERTVHPQQIKINKKGDLQFLKYTHGLEKRGYLNYFLMRGNNLLHKTKLLLRIIKK